MGFIDVEHHLAGVAPLDLNELTEIGLVAIHAEDALGDDDDLLVGVNLLLQQPFQVEEVVVAVALGGGGREAEAVDEAGVN